MTKPTLATAGRNSDCGFSPTTFSRILQKSACQESCWTRNPESARRQHLIMSIRVSVTWALMRAACAGARRFGEMPGGIEPRPEVVARHAVDRDHDLEAAQRRGAAGVEDRRVGRRPDRHHR